MITKFHLVVCTSLLAFVLIAPGVARGGWSGAVIQRTPQRVAHRRADKERERHVTIETVRSIAPQTVELQVHCQHGTYVKEWISGDDGRSVPSFRDLLGVTCSCAELDVLEVLVDDSDFAAAPDPFGTGL